MIKDLLFKSERPFKVFILNRPDNDIRKQFDYKSNIEIQIINNQTNIKKIVRKEIAKYRR